MNKVIITAHSGCEGTPENSMEHLHKAIELKAGCVEIDVNMDPQGNLWLTHNLLEDYSACVSLKAALDVIAGADIAVNCDIKDERLLCPTLEAAEAAGVRRENLVFSGSVNVELLRKDPSIAKRARIFLNLEQIYPFLPYEKPANRDEEGVYFDAHAEEIAAVVKEVGAECINPCYVLMTDARIALARRHGIKLSLWTIDDAAVQAAYLQKDLVNITTRNVSSALKLCEALDG